MAQKPETVITRAIIESIIAAGGDAFHVHGSMFQRKGEPDICGEIEFRGKLFHLKIEVKTKTGKPDPLQVYRLQRYHLMDYVAGVVRSVEQFNYLLHLHHAYLKEHRQMGFKEFAGGYDDLDIYKEGYKWGRRLYG